jgi:hypothetical protein
MTRIKFPLCLAALALLLSAAMILPAKADVSFLEAALYFLTAIEPTQGDTVNGSKIILARYPIVAYLVDDKPCAVRIRTTTQPYTIWQMDFCKITYYQWSSGTWIFVGEPNAFCKGRWNRNEDYSGAIERIASPMFGRAMCGVGDGATGQLAFIGITDISDFIELGYKSHSRSQPRLMQSFKYIEMLLTPAEQRKPY